MASDGKLPVAFSDSRKEFAMHYVTRRECEERYAPLDVALESVGFHIIHQERGDLWVARSRTHGTHMIKTELPIMEADLLVNGDPFAQAWQMLFVCGVPVAALSTPGQTGSEPQWTYCESL